MLVGTEAPPRLGGPVPLQFSCDNDAIRAKLHSIPRCAETVVELIQRVLLDSSIIASEGVG